MKLYFNETYATEKEDIVGIFDMDSATVSRDTLKFLADCEKEGRATVTTGEIPVSFVVSAAKNSKIRIFFTRNAPRALARRTKLIGM